MLIKRFFNSLFSDPTKTWEHYISLLKNDILFLYNIYYNPHIKKQLKNPLEIPILIINFNQLYYLKKQIDFLVNRGFQNIIIVDNQSHYPPLLEYYESLKNQNKVKVIYMDNNYGHKVFWLKPELYQKYGKGYYVISDADIVPIEDCPKDFMKLFISILRKERRISKVGFSLLLDDIPDTNKNKEIVLKWESKYWKRKTKENHFYAALDTTFALYHPHNMFRNEVFFDGVRTNKPYIARHGGWYIDPKNLTDEQNYYMKTANSSSSWKIDENGFVLKKSYSKFK